MKFNEVLQKWCDVNGYKFFLHGNNPARIWVIEARFSNFYLNKAGLNNFNFLKSTKGKLNIRHRSSGTLADLMRYIEKNDYTINLQFGA